VAPLRALAFFCVIGLAGAAPALGSWTKPREIASGGLNLTDLAAVGNRRGDTLVLWSTEQQGLEVARSARGGPFGPPVLLPGSQGATDPRLAIDASGRALIAWTWFDNSRPSPPDVPAGLDCCDRVRAIMLSPAGKPGTAVTVSPAGEDARLDALAISRTGIGIAWGGLSGSFGRTLGTLGPPERVATASYGPVALLMHRGETSIAYVSAGALVERVRAAGARLSGERFLLGPRWLSHLTVEPPTPFAFAGDGSVVAAFGSGNSRHGARLNGLVAGPSIKGTVESIFRAPKEFIPPLALATSDGGAALIAASPAEPFGPLVAAYRPPGRRFERARILDRRRPFSVVAPAIAVSPRGLGLVAWPDSRALVVRVRDKAGRFGKTVELTPSTQVGGIAAAIDGRDRATVAWTDGTRVLFSRGPR
jgi:hypothetical protein